MGYKTDLKFQQTPQEGGWSAGLQSRTSLYPRKLSNKGFKIYKGSELKKQ